jgi:hypothetical protein
LTTYIPFVPSIQAPFQFQATLDGNIYTIQCTWNLFGQRFYINIYDASNTLIVCRPQVGSPATYNINLLAGYFLASVLVYRASTGNFEVDPPTPAPLNFPIPFELTSANEYFLNDGGVLVVGYVTQYPISPIGLHAGAVWNNGQTICMAGTTTPDPAAPPVFFNVITPPQLLALGAGNLPTSVVTPGNLQLWNNGGLICIA